MIEWTAAEEKNFQELVKRAEQQSREYYIRSGGEPQIYTQKTTPPQPQQHHAPTVTPHAPQRPNRGVTPPQHSTNYSRAVQQGSNRGIVSNRQINNNSSRTPPQQHHSPTVTPPASQRPNRGVTPPPPQRYRVKRKSSKSLLPEIDSETALLAALLWLLWQEEADITVILAVAYILLV